MWGITVQSEDDDKCSNDEKTKKGPPTNIFRSFQGSSVCLLMQMTQKTLHGIQMGEIVMECFAIWLILLNGRRLIACIQILTKMQEILGLDLPVME